MADIANGTGSFDEYANGVKIAGLYVDAFIDKADLTVKKGGSVMFSAGKTLAIALDVGTLPSSIPVMSSGMYQQGTLTLIAGRVYKFGAKAGYTGDATIKGSTGSFTVSSL